MVYHKKWYIKSTTLYWYYAQKTLPAGAKPAASIWYPPLTLGKSMVSRYSSAMFWYAPQKPQQDSTASKRVAPNPRHRCDILKFTRVQSQPRTRSKIYRRPTTDKHQDPGSKHVQNTSGEKNHWEMLSISPDWHTKAALGKYPQQYPWQPLSTFPRLLWVRHSTDFFLSSPREAPLN